VVSDIPDDFVASIFRTGVKMETACHLRMLVHTSFHMFKILKLEVHNKHSLKCLNAKLNPICHLLALIGGATIVVVSRLRVKCDLLLI
jgi:hypothetical protein